MTTTNEFESLERDLEAAFAVPVPGRRFEPDQFPKPADARSRRGWAVGGIAAAVAVIGAIVLLPGLRGGGATAVNAEELVNKSSAATAALTSGSQTYHLKAVMGGKVNGSSTLEIWFFGDAGNRSEQSINANGVTESRGQVATPNDYWLWVTEDGQTNVAHVAGTTPRVTDETPAASIDNALQGLLIPGCQEAINEGEATVAGRPAAVVLIRATPETCVPDPNRPETQKLAAVSRELGNTRLWIDKETFVQLKVQSFDASGVILKNYEVQLFETGKSVDAGALNYVPPAGANVVQVATYSDAKSAVYPDKKPAPVADDSAAAEQKRKSGN